MVYLGTSGPYEANEANEANGGGRYQMRSLSEKADEQMSSTLLFQISYPRKPEDLRDEYLVRTWLEAIAAEGYYLTQQQEPLPGEPQAQRQTSPGISALAYRDAHTFCAGQSDPLDCNARLVTEPHDLLDVGVALSSSEGWIVLTADDGFFTFGETRQHRYDLFVQLVEVTATVWHPLYGCLVRGGNTPDTTADDARALQIKCLCDISVFGPELVDRIGRERVLTAPAWQIRRLSDGGIVLVPYPYVREDLHHPSPYTRRAVARHLNIPYQDPDASQVLGH